MLTGIVRRALESDRVIIRTWQISSIPYRSVIATSAGLYRVRGTATDGTEQLPWSVILKIVQSSGPQTQAITAFDYWKREPLAYASGIIDHLPGGLAAPRCWGLFDIAETSVWMWLEDISDVYERRWPLSRYGVAAHHFGVFNASYLVGSRPLPTEPWLADARARWTAVRSIPVHPTVFDPDAWRHLPSRMSMSALLFERLRVLWAARSTLLDSIARQPLTLLHFDANAGNLFARDQHDGHRETVAIDWANIGTGALGEELNQLVISPMNQFLIGVDQVYELEECAFAGYIDGLREAGWQGDNRLVRLGYTVSLSVRAVLIVRQLQRLQDAAYQESEVRRWSRPVEEIAAQRVAILHFMLDRADEARSLQSIL